MSTPLDSMALIRRGQKTRRPLDGAMNSHGGISGRKGILGRSGRLDGICQDVFLLYTFPACLLLRLDDTSIPFGKLSFLHSFLSFLSSLSFIFPCLLTPCIHLRVYPC